MIIPLFPPSSQQFLHSNNGLVFQLPEGSVVPLTKMGPLLKVFFWMKILNKFNFEHDLWCHFHTQVEKLATDG